MPNCFPDAEQEREWELERIACYNRWREQAIDKCVRYVTSSANHWQRGERLMQIRRKLEPNADSFMLELATRIKDET